MRNILTVQQQQLVNRTDYFYDLNCSVKTWMGPKGIDPPSNMLTCAKNEWGVININDGNTLIF